MTKQQWLACPTPTLMLDFLRDRASDRKLRLFACACCRHIWHLLGHERSKNAIEVAERYADGAVTEQQLWEANAAVSSAEAAVWGVNPAAAATRLVVDAASAAEGASTLAGKRAHELWRQSEDELTAMDQAVWNAATWEREREDKHQADLLRDISGNPMDRIVVNPAWFTGNGVDLPQMTRALYEVRRLPDGTLDGNRLAALADALEEAGCKDQDILSHCREKKPHVRGCWVVDLLLGKT